MGSALDSQPAPVRETPGEPDVAAVRVVPWWRSGAWWLGAGARSVPYVISAVVTFAVALWTYRPWKFDGAIANLWGDPLAFHAWVQATMEDGWYENATRLAAPYGMNSHTYTVTDEFLFVLIGKVLGPITGSAGAAVTWWVVLCFPLAAVFAVGAARYLGVGRAAALLPGIAFPLVPDHFLRAGGHFSLSSVWAISLGMLAVLSLVRSPRLTGGRRVAFEVSILVACVAISLTNAYYATFIGLLVAAAAVGGAVAARSWRIVALGVARGVALIGPIVVAMLMDAFFAPKPFGYSSFEVTRSEADAEVYGGKIFAMLLPSTLHRFGLFRDIRTSYDATFPNPAETPALGLVAAIGFVALLVWSLLLHFRRHPELADSRLKALSALVWVSLIAFVVGGLGSAWSFLLGGGGIRVWSRMHVVIALLVLLAAAVALDRLRPRLLRLGVVAVVLGVVLVDQTFPMARPDPAYPLAVRAEVTGFTDAVADEAGRTAMIFQAPQVTFPVAQKDVAPASVYDGFLPYLYSTGLHWSYGGLSGDPRADWQNELTKRPFAEQAAMLDAAGFAGVSLDRSALVSDPGLEEQIHATLGEPTVVSSSGRWQYFPFGDDLLTGCDPSTVTELGDLAVAPALLYPGTGAPVAPGPVANNRIGPAELRIVTLREGGWSDVTVHFDVNTPAALRLTFPDGSTRDLAGGSSTTVTWSGPAEASEVVVRIDRTGGAGTYTVSGMSSSVTPSASAQACLAAGAEKTPAP
jgi:hypothetical protein